MGRGLGWGVFILKLNQAKKVPGSFFIKTLFFRIENKKQFSKPNLIESRLKIAWKKVPGYFFCEDFLIYFLEKIVAVIPSPHLWLTPLQIYTNS